MTYHPYPRDPWFRPDKITLARQARGLTMIEAATRIGITARRLSELERDLIAPADNDKERISQGLGFPVSFFAQPDLVLDFRDMFVSKLD